MHATRNRNSLKYAFVLAPLLAACGGGGGGGPITLPPGGLQLPDCADGSLLVTDASGAAQCGSAPNERPNIPGNCADNQALNSDGKLLSCVDKASAGGGNPLNTKITTLSTKVDDLTTKAKNLTGASSTATYVGNSTASNNGNHLGFDNATDNGLAATAKICTTQYGGGAHMCSVQEIYLSAVKGVISSAKNITKAWVYAPFWQNPTAGSVNPTLGYGDTCGSYTYPTGDKNWRGMAVSTGANEQTTRWGIRWIGGADANCASALPIACCK